MTLDEVLQARKITLNLWWSGPLPRVCCPRCRIDLTESTILVCSRHCEHCGARVIDPDPEGDEPTPEEELALPTVDEYIDDVRPYNWALRWGIRLMLVAFVIGFAMIPIVRWHFPGRPPEWLFTMMLGWVCVGIPFLIVIVFAVATIRSAWNPTLSCPNCKQADVDWAENIISSRCCSNCGVRQLLDNPTEAKSTRPLYSLSGVIEHRKQRDQNQRYGIAISVLSAFLAALIVYCFGGPGTPLHHVSTSLSAVVVGFIMQTCVELYLFYFIPLRCIHCRRGLHNYGLMIATQHCYRCGERVIAEPDTLPPEIGHDAG